MVIMLAILLGSFLTFLFNMLYPDTFTSFSNHLKGVLLKAKEKIKEFIK